MSRLITVMVSYYKPIFDDTFKDSPGLNFCDVAEFIIDNWPEGGFRDGNFVRDEPYHYATLEKTIVAKLWRAGLRWPRIRSGRKKKM